MIYLFWVSFLVISYVYLIYPALVCIFSFSYRPIIKNKGHYPTISIILAAYNEERFIEQKILALLGQDYPKDQMEILIGSDGSNDKTDEIVLKYKNFGVKLFRNENRSGKPAMLNMLVAQAKGDILVFFDARQGVEKNAIAEIVSNFGVAEVGSVSGQLLFRQEKKEGKASEGVGLYWQYEKLIRYCESKTGSMLGATGAFYAIRRSLYPRLPEDIVLDDVYIPMKIALGGFRSIYDEEAIIFDKVVSDPQKEFVRKARTLAGNFQFLRYCPELLNPFAGKIAWQFFSHKFMRLVVPYFFIFLLLSNAFLLNKPFLKLFFFLQVIFYVLAVTGMICKRSNRLTDIPAMFCVMNAAAVAGLWRFLTGNQDIKWEKTSR